MAEVAIYVIKTTRTNILECLFCRYRMELRERHLYGLIMLTNDRRAHIRDAESGVIVHVCVPGNLALRKVHH